MIIEQISVIPNFLGQPDKIYHEKETGRKFRRIYGGMQWPGTNPGAVVVLAEDLEIDAAVDEHKILILAEYENRSPSEIMTRCKELKGLMKVEKFYGDTTNRPMMSLMRRGKLKINLLKAPFIDEPDVYVNNLLLIREKISDTKKVLSFGEGSALPAMLSSLSSIPTGNSLKSDYPKIAALGYSLSALISYSYSRPCAHSVGFQHLDPIVGY
ncbi:MAG: hypothetical protein KKD69_03885 [Euryarchaeota archaeon]|nr:hypothetical protein [Euryarchaeota archaeon]